MKTDPSVVAFGPAIRFVQAAASGACKAAAESKIAKDKDVRVMRIRFS